MIHLEVAVAAPLPQTLSYRLDYDILYGNGKDAPESFIGRRVLVPLGKRITGGYVLGLLEGKEEPTRYVLKNIHDVIDDFPLFHANIVPFFRWVARYYHFPIGEVISAALPAGLQKKSRKILRVCRENKQYLTVWPYSDIEKPLWFDDLLQKMRLGGVTSRSILKNRQHKKTIARLVADGYVLLETEISKDLVREKIEFCYTTALDWRVFDNLSGDKNEDLDDFASWIKLECSQKLKLSEIKTLYYHKKLSGDNNGKVPYRDILAQYKGAAKALTELNRRGIVKKISKRVYRNPFGQILTFSPSPESLSDEQNTVLVSIRESLAKKEYTTFLLHGVTGSGKTEVYLQAAASCLQAGMDILVLVPEIALATQLESHFVSRFGDQVVLLHSGLSVGEKYDQWCLAAAGKAKIVIGARSAIFAPLENIGLIVVDEEHDSGYKQDTGLKYNARDLAVLRASFDNATVVLGSATPSITSYYHTKTGKYTLLTMANRIGNSVLPMVELIDLKQEKGTKKQGVFHEKFEKQLALNLEREEQSLILLNRRGFSTSYICQECGAAVSCQHCNVTLTYHKHKAMLVCHYCGFSLSSKLVCSTCRSDALIPYGFGTERIEEELGRLFPQAVISRLDSDTATDRKKFLHILKGMHNQDIDILIGTQMIAKGHHFPNVTFVGVVWADGGLNMPDFRAAERTYQLLSQVTGRAGRGDKKGRVLIQTMRPGHYAIELARTHQYKAFFEKEIRLRCRPVFPPFVRLVCLRMCGDVEYNVLQTSQKVATACKEFNRVNHSTTEVLGPVASPLEKIQDLYRWQILLKSVDTTCLHDICHHILKNTRDLAVGKTEISVDIDPENMM